ncbi:ROK family protein [Arthrobacter sp. ISL-48]|uniref:ROK family protein n=1 Tax=Arthrobacter sp. ISL-48 TaxID=2819110 RepID=UPI001BEBAB46|nr:ROK family protein [Arthrobacter sp. ISL-48]MBT2532584.1 ROK family protein [Arthrobacter sp. ISL-48]
MAWPAVGPVLAFDVGGTDIKSGIVLAGNEIIGLKRSPTPRSAPDPGEAILAVIAHLTTRYRTAYPELPFDAVGFVVPGLVDETAGIGILSSNLGWRDFPFAARARALLDTHVAFGHDVAAAGEAEFRGGAAMDSDDAIVMVNGTGIAAAVFCDGRRIKGGGYAGELGHAVVPDPDDPLRTVMLESVGSAGAIAARYSAASGQAVAGSRDVLHLASTGDKVAQRVWDQAIDALAFSIAQCICILGTETVVMGGGISGAGESLLAPLRRAVDGRLTLPKRPRIVPALLGENAGLLGAALKARQLLNQHPGGLE